MNDLSIAVLLFNFLLADTTSGREISEELADRIRQGDKKAFRTLFDTLHKPLLRYLLSKNIEIEAAKDLVQKVFIYIWEHRSKIEPDKSLRSYLFRIAYTRMLNHIRDHKKFDKSEAVPSAISTENPEKDARDLDIREAIDKALASMPEKRSTVFQLCYLQEFTYKEAAGVLDVSVKTIQNHMSLALEDMRNKLEDLRT